MIRTFEKRDLARLYQLDQACFPPEIAYSRAELLYFLTQPRCSSWVAETAGTIVGFIITERIRLHQQTAGHVVTLDVDPTARRQGFGAMLMLTAEQQLIAEGATRMRLEVAQNNLVAQDFYRRLGFTVIGRIAKYYGGKIDADVMDKSISVLPGALAVDS